MPTMDPAATPSTPAPALFKPIRSARAFEEIAAQIRAELAGGRLAIGSRLPSERALAEQFGVSRNTLREALRSLEHAGLIKLQKGATGGAFISGRGGEAIITGLGDLYHLGAIEPGQLTEARIWLEGAIVRAACERAAPEDIAELNRIIDAAEQAARLGDFENRAKRHFDFHRTLTRITKNPIMIIVMDGVLDILHHFVQSIGDYQNTFVFASRRRFMKHFEAKDADAAAKEMEECLKRLQRVYLSNIKNKKVSAGAKPATVKSAPRKLRSSVGA